MQNENLNLFLLPKEDVAILPIENKQLLTAEKADLSEMASLICEAVDDGEADALDTLIMAKKGMYVFEAIAEAMKGKVQDPGKGYKRHSCDIREQMTGVRYAFGACGDPIWDAMNIQAMILKEQMKQREDWLKGFTKSTEVEEVTDEDTGEIQIHAGIINPPVKTGGSSIIITIK